MTKIWKSGRAWLLVIGIGVLVGVMDASQAYLLLPAIGRRLPLTRVLLVNVSYWMSFAALVPAVFFLADRVRLDGPFRWTQLLIHTLAAVAFVLVHFAFAAFVVLTRSDIGQTVGERFFNLLRNYSAGNFLQYWAIVGIFYTLHYYQEARQKELQAVQLQASLIEAQLQALRSQLNPHFLFNTLNTIFVLAQKGDQRAVMETLSQLSELLRASLDDKRPLEITLSEELAFLDGYLEIQRRRFSDRLTVQYQIAPETRDALVPNMILQPLLENAIRYGVTEQVGKAHITVQSTRDGDTLNLQVRDNGPGFGAKVRPRSAKGIGLSNTEARLRYLYGGQQTVQYGTQDVPGGVVMISFPFRTGPETFAG